MYQGNFTRFYHILVKNTTFDYNFINLNLNVTKFCVLIDNAGIDKLHDIDCDGNHLGRKL